MRIHTVLLLVASVSMLGCSAPQPAAGPNSNPGESSSSSGVTARDDGSSSDPDVGLTVQAVCEEHEITCEGEQGAAGPAGAPGAPGATGTTGGDGADGVDGQDGATGAPGSTGQAGQRGGNGQDGADGADGQDGSDGADGSVDPDAIYIVTKTSPSASGEHVISASCDDGDLLMTGGCQAVNAVFLRSSYPGSSLLDGQLKPKTWLCEGYSSYADGGLIATAVCVNLP